MIYLWKCGFWRFDVKFVRSNYTNRTWLTMYFTNLLSEMLIETELFCENGFNIIINVINKNIELKYH